MKRPVVTVLLQERDASWSRHLDLGPSEALTLTRRFKTLAIVFDEANSQVLAVFRHGREVNHHTIQEERT